MKCFLRPSLKILLIIVTETVCINYVLFHLSLRMKILRLVALYNQHHGGLYRIAKFLQLIINLNYRLITIIILPSDYF
jgi:hypothetical protein